MITSKLDSIKNLAKKILYWPTSPSVARAIGEPILRRAGRFPRSEEIQLSELRRVLVIRLDSIGDLVLMTPFLRELRRNLPQAWISLIVKPEVFNLMEKCPYVQEVLTFDLATIKYVTPYVRHWQALKLALKHLWPRRFDLAILPRWDVDDYHGTMLAYLSGACWRLGWSENVNPLKQLTNRGFDQLFTNVLDQREPKHELLRNLDVLRYFSGIKIRDNRLKIWITEEDKSYADSMLFDQGGHRNRKLIAMGPGASIRGKCWPPERFVELASWIQKNHGAKIVIIGGREDEALGIAICSKLKQDVINLIGKTTLRQTVAVLSHCQLYIGNDSGPMHMAAAANVPIIEISQFPQNGNPQHRQSPMRFGPWGVPSRVLQPERPTNPCTDGCKASEAHCILGVTVEQVQEAVRDLLDEPNQAPGVLPAQVTGVSP